MPTAPTHSQTRPTSPLRPSLTIGRTFEFPSTFLCTRSQTFFRLDALNSSRSTSSRSWATLM